LKRFFSATSVDLHGLSEYLDSLDNRTRIREVRSLGPKEQALLFDQARGFRPLSLEDFVPANVPPLRQVIHYGKNSLPAFTIFEKRFCRPAPGERNAAGLLWGYNEQPLRRLTGPGYFVVRAAPEGEVVIDYCEIPPSTASRPGGWPRILPNSARLSRFIYYRTKDYMRGVSTHVSIGRATRDGRVMNNWFVLCREE
jgi:hypothetical protein